MKRDWLGLAPGADQHPTLWMFCLWGLPLASLLVSIAYAFQVDGAMLSADESSYLEYARAWSQHGDFLVEREPGPISSSFWPPLWPILLSCLDRLLSGIMVARTFNAGLLALTLHLAARICRARGDIAPGALIVGMSAYIPVACFTAVVLVPQTLCGTLLMLSLWLIGRRPRVRGWQPWLFLVIGLMVLTNLALVPGLLLGLMLLAMRRSIGWPTWIAAVLVSILVAGGWVARNHLVHGHAVFATNAGVNLALGNSPQTRPDSGVRVDLSASGVNHATQDEYEINKLYSRYAIQNILGDPAHYAVLYLRKLAYWFAPSNTFATADLSSRWKDHLLMACSLALFGGTLAAFATRRVGRRDDDYYILGAYLGAAMFYAIFFARIRFRVPVDALLVPLAALGVQGIAVLIGLAPRPPAPRRRPPDRVPPR